MAVLLATGAIGACSSSASPVGSVGAVLGRDDETGAVVIREVPEGMAANQAGLVPGDEVVMVDGHFVRNVEVEGLRALLRGEPGTKVRLTIVRGGRVMHVELTRTPLKSVELRPRETRIEE